MGRAGDRGDVVRADQSRVVRQDGVRDVTARCRIAADKPDRDAGGGRVCEVAQPAVPVAVVEEHGTGRSLVQLGQRPGLGADIAVVPFRVRGTDRSDRRVDVRVAVLVRCRHLCRHECVGHDRRVKEDQGRRSEPRGGKGGSRHRAPRVADDLQRVPIHAGRTDKGRDVGRVVAEPVVALPMPGLSVARLVDGHDPPVRGGERWPDPPPDGRGRGHAVDQQQRPRPRIAPGQRRPRDPGRLDDEAFALGRRPKRSGHGGRQVRIDHRPTVAPRGG